jgi:hypothetical protein
VLVCAAFCGVGGLQLRFLRWLLADTGAIVQHTFRLIETRMTKLWDFGWFDVSRFEVSHPSAIDSAAMLDDLVRDPVFQRSFCEQPDPWGQNTERHGPYTIATFESKWFIEISVSDLCSAINEAVAVANPDLAPDPEQRRPISDWIVAAQKNGADAWRLDVPDVPGIRVEWSSIWCVYDEFLWYDPLNRMLHLAVIGYD